MFPSSPPRCAPVPPGARLPPEKLTRGLKVHSFQVLLSDLATIVKNRIQPKDKKIPTFDMLTTPTKLQQQAFDLLGVALRLN